MLFILRQLRRLELHKRSGRYFVYAIGEVILVVIGILIALQINNWAEAKKAREFEVKMLVEIKKALEQDYIFWADHISARVNITKDALAYFENYLRTGEIEMEAASSHFRDFRAYWRGEFITGPWEALKSTGLDKVSSDELRSRLVYHYDFFCPRQIKLTNAFIDGRRNEYFEVESKLIGSPLVSLEKDHLAFSGPFLVTLDLKSNPDFAEALNIMWKQVNFSEREIEESVTEIRKMIELIEEEIRDEI